MKKIFMIIVGLMIGQVQAGIFDLRTGDDFDEGIEYSVINNPVKTETGSKVEVRELFWYYCPHCESLEDNVEEWLSMKDDSSEFVRQPAVFSARWKSGSDFYYIMKDIGILDTHHGKLFKAIHVERKNIQDKDDFLEWLNENGISQKITKKYNKNFNIWMATNKATKQTPKYEATGVPVIIVDGRYRVDTKSAGSEGMVFKVVDYLIEKIKKEQSAK